MFDFDEVINSSVKKFDSSPLIHSIFNNPLIVGVLIVGSIILVAYFTIDDFGESTSIMQFATYASVASVGIVFLHHRIMENEYINKTSIDPINRVLGGGNDVNNYSADNMEINPVIDDINSFIVPTTNTNGFPPSVSV